MGTNPVMKLMALHRCREVDWDRKSVRDGFVSYKFETGEVIGLEAQTVPANERVRSSDESPKFFTLPVVPVYFRCGVS